MNDETRALIEYRMKRSKEALDEAELMLNNGHVNTFINRLYYACFYAVNAILLEKGLLLQNTAVLDRCFISK